MRKTGGAHFIRTLDHQQKACRDACAGISFSKDAFDVHCYENGLNSGKIIQKNKVFIEGQDLAVDNAQPWNSSAIPNLFGGKAGKQPAVLVAFDQIVDPAFLVS